MVVQKIELHPETARLPSCGRMYFRTRKRMRRKTAPLRLYLWPSGPAKSLCASTPTKNPQSGGKVRSPLVRVRAAYFTRTSPRTKFSFAFLRTRTPLRTSLRTKFFSVTDRPSPADLGLHLQRLQPLSISGPSCRSCVNRTPHFRQLPIPAGLRVCLRV
jgi:hypothetical protein